MKEYRRFLIVLFGIILTGCFGLIMLVVISDPFFQYRTPDKNRSYVIDNQLSQNPGLARNAEYNAVSLGSSVTVNYSTAWFKELFGLDVVKLPYNGAYPRDIVNAMEQVSRSDNEIETVFLGLDITAYSAETEQIKYPLPEYLYDDCILNDVTYWFNKDVLLNYILKPMLDPTQGSMWTEYYCTWDLFEYSKKNVLAYYTPVERSAEQYEVDFLLSGVMANMEENICPLIEKHPDTKFMIYFPPSSILFWYDFECLNQTEAILYNEQYVIERLLAYDNVEIYYFQNDFELITNLDNYTDYVHYSREVSRMMLEQMAQGEHRITMENYLDILKEMQEYIQSYNYSSIWE